MRNRAGPPGTGNDNPLAARSSQICQHDFQASPHVTVIRQGILHVEIREAGLLGHSSGSEQVLDALPRDGGDLDVALPSQALEVQVG